MYRITAPPATPSRSKIAGEILADGQSSRLYKDLVIDKRMVVDISVDYDMTSFDPGLFWVSAQMRPGVKADDAIAEVDRQIAALRDQAVSCRGIAQGQKSRAGRLCLSARTRFSTKPSSSGSIRCSATTR